MDLKLASVGSPSWVLATNDGISTADAQSRVNRAPREKKLPVVLLYILARLTEKS